MQNNMIIQALQFHAVLAFYCYAQPYLHTLQYYSGYGIATNKSNSNKTRKKGWILYAFLWWLPFVTSFLIGSFYLCYFTALKLIELGIVLSHLIVGIARLSLEMLSQSLEALKSNLVEFFEASIELLADLATLIIGAFSQLKELFKKQQPEHASSESAAKSWKNATLVTDICKSLTSCGQALHEVNFRVNQAHERQYQAIKRKQK